MEKKNTEEIEMEKTTPSSQTAQERNKSKTWDNLERS